VLATPETIICERLGRAQERLISRNKRSVT
jgi:hypothetical protein